MLVSAEAEQHRTAVEQAMEAKVLLRLRVVLITLKAEPNLPKKTTADSK
jgi:hypothetical protein